MSFKNKLCRIALGVALGPALHSGADLSMQKGERPRARDAGLTVGILPTGPLNSITDVAGVAVGHTTLVRGADIRTGATAVLPHTGNLFQEKVPGAVFIGNAF